MLSDKNYSKWKIRTNPQAILLLCSTYRSL